MAQSGADDRSVGCLGGDEATVEFVNARGLDAKPVSEISLMDGAPSYESKLSRTTTEHTRIVHHGFLLSPNRRMKLLDFGFQLNQTLIR